jgi:hypothetical protein
MYHHTKYSISTMNVDMLIYFTEEEGMNRSRKFIFKILLKSTVKMKILNLTFNDVVHRSIGGEISNDGDFLMFEGNRYSRKGYLYKHFVMNAIVAEGVKPTLAELEKFEEAPEGIAIELGQLVFSILSVCCNFDIVLSTKTLSACAT